MKKRGLSPVVATMLLIVIVIIIGLIIFFWFRGFNQEAITKFDGTNVKLVCDEVSFDASLTGDVIFIMNTGNVPIYKMKIKLVGDGSHETTTLETDWPTLGLPQGSSYSGTVVGASSQTKLIVIPVLIGQTSEGEKEYTCEEGQGYEILV